MLRAKRGFGLPMHSSRSQLFSSYRCNSNSILDARKGLAPSNILYIALRSGALVNVAGRRRRSDPPVLLDPNDFGITRRMKIGTCGNASTNYSSNVYPCVATHTARAKSGANALVRFL